MKRIDPRGGLYGPHGGFAVPCRFRAAARVLYVSAHQIANLLPVIDNKNTAIAQHEVLLDRGNRRRCLPRLNVLVGQARRNRHAKRASLIELAFKGNAAP